MKFLKKSLLHHGSYLDSFTTLVNMLVHTQQSHQTLTCSPCQTPCNICMIMSTKFIVTCCVSGYHMMYGLRVTIYPPASLQRRPPSSYYCLKEENATLSALDNIGCFVKLVLNTFSCFYFYVSINRFRTVAHYLQAQTFCCTPTLNIAGVTPIGLTDKLLYKSQ